MKKRLLLALALVVLAPALAHPEGRTDTQRANIHKFGEYAFKRNVEDWRKRTKELTKAARAWDSGEEVKLCTDQNASFLTGKRCRRLLEHLIQDQVTQILYLMKEHERWMFPEEGTQGYPRSKQLQEDFNHILRVRDLVEEEGARLAIPGFFTPQR